MYRRSKKYQQFRHALLNHWQPEKESNSAKLMKKASIQHYQTYEKRLKSPVTIWVKKKPLRSSYFKVTELTATRP